MLLTGATGTMGMATLKELIKENIYSLRLFIFDSPKERKKIKPFIKDKKIEIIYGDLTKIDDVRIAMIDVDIVLHCAALVSPEADDQPQLAMRINYGSTKNIVTVIKEQLRADSIKLVYIGTVAMTGDRTPPIHWGSIGDPIKPSYHDYYAVSKIAAERVVVESGLKYWVSLRQTGILSHKMSKIKDPIMFHNGLDNVIEYVTEQDAGILMSHCCRELPDDFWGHIYNIGGGSKCRMSGYELLNGLFTRLGFKHLEYIVDSQWFVTHNFHGHYYLDSDRLEQFLKFRNQDTSYFFETYLKNMGPIVYLLRFVNQSPRIEKLTAKIIRHEFIKFLNKNRSPMYWIRNRMFDYIQPFFITMEAWMKIPKINKWICYEDFGATIDIKRGYDKEKPESELSIEDLKTAAAFRGGVLLSDQMIQGDWNTKLDWKCAFGHSFSASPRLILEGGHWCHMCEKKSWNYHEIAKVSPYFAQVWYPLHDQNEPSFELPKIVSEDDIDNREFKI